jgi:hypothetical protein
MGWGEIHLIALLSTTFAAAAVIGRAPQRATITRAVVATTIGLLVSLVALTISLHACGNGTPVAQWALPAACVVAVLTLARPSPLRSAAATAFALAACVLSLHYAQLVHEPGYVGRAEPFGSESARNAPFWHTPLTGLYERAEAPADLTVEAP